jgi:hypothetical protein
MAEPNQDHNLNSGERPEVNVAESRSSGAPESHDPERGTEGDESEFVGILSVGSSNVEDLDDEDDGDDIHDGIGDQGDRQDILAGERSQSTLRSGAITRTPLQSTKPLLNRLFGRDFSVADSMFPDELEPKVRAQIYPLTESDYWHLRRLEQKTRYYRRSLPVGIAVLAIVALLGVIFFNFGPIQLLAFFACIYWMLGLYLKSGILRRLLAIYMTDLEKEPTPDPER